MGERDETETATPGERAGPPDPGEAIDEVDLPTLVGSRYQLGRRLGAGGMGVVYIARDIHLGRDVAIKLVNARIDAASGQARLQREGQAMARLRHPNIATVYDIGANDDRLFIVMEFVDGGTLVDWLRARKRSWREIVGVLLQAARGLAAAHAAGFVHRDFKPENLLIGTDGIVRVSDFGVARLVGEAEAPEAGQQASSGTRSGDVVGTPGYIAPEILRHEPVDARADQFSLCVTLYAALEGRRPFEELETPNRIGETLGAVRPPRADSAPRWLQRMVMRGLAPRPADRWPTVDALASAIERRLGRRRLTAGLAGLGLTALAAMAVLMFTRPAHEPTPDWSPVVIGRETKDSIFPAMIVTRDGSTLVRYSDTEASVEPRIGEGPRRHVAFPPGLTSPFIRPSVTGDRLFCAFSVGTGDKGGVEIWAIDVATNIPHRLVPPDGQPSVKPASDFDVAADGSIVFPVRDSTAIWRVGPSGNAERLLSAEPGERLLWPSLSPGGARLVFNVLAPKGSRMDLMDTETRAVTKLRNVPCLGREWLTDHSLVCCLWSFRRVVLLELLLSPGADEAKEVVLYRGPEYQRPRWLYASSSGVIFATTPSDSHLGLIDLSAHGKVRPLALDSTADLPPVGWTSSGSLIFGANVQGHLRIHALRPDGRIELLRTGPDAEVPLAVLGETIVFGRFPGSEHTLPFVGTPGAERFFDGELSRLLPGGALESLGETHGFDALICAAARMTPCLLAERSGDEVVAVDWDPATGNRGRERARWSRTFWNPALSPDGRTLLQVQLPRGIPEVSILDLTTGHRRRLDFPYLGLPQWLPDGTVLAIGVSEGRGGIVRIHDIEGAASVELVVPWDEWGISPGPFAVSLDGKTAAVQTQDERNTYWWADRPKN